MKLFEKPFSEMTVDEKSAAYDHMIRNCSTEQIKLIESSGPLNDNEFIRARQEVYRMLIQSKTGVILPDSATEMMHHPV